MLVLDKEIFAKDLADRVEIIHLFELLVSKASGDAIVFSLRSKDQNKIDYVCILSTSVLCKDGKFNNTFTGLANPFIKIIYDESSKDLTHYIFLYNAINIRVTDAYKLRSKLSKELLKLFKMDNYQIDASKFSKVEFDIKENEILDGYIVCEFTAEIDKLNLNFKTTKDNKPLAYFRTEGSMFLAKNFFEEVIPDFEKRVLKLVEQADAPQPQPIITTGIEDDGIKTTLENEAENEGQQTTTLENFGDEPKPPKPPKPPKEFIKPEVDDVIRIGSDQFAIVESVKDDNIKIKNISKDEAMDILKSRKEFMEGIKKKIDKIK